MKKAIEVRLNLPETAEGLETLRQAVEKANSIMLAAALEKVDASAEEKRAYVASLKGRVPWAK